MGLFSRILKKESYSSATHDISCEGKRIEIALDVNEFARDGRAELFLKNNELTVVVKSKATNQGGVAPKVESSGEKDGLLSSPSGMEAGKDTSSSGEPERKGERLVIGNKVPGGRPAEPVHFKKPLRPMLYDNVSWKEPHSMTLEEFSALNEQYRYGKIDSLVEETVELPEGIKVKVEKGRISVESDEWHPAKGDDSGQFEIELPKNGLKLSLFVIRPVSELLVYKKVRDDVKYQKKDEDSGQGKSGSFRWVFASTRGPSHRNSDKLCRDDDVNVWHDSVNDTLYLVVADGAGSAKYAREGARIAVKEMVNYFKDRHLRKGMFDSASGCQVVREEIHRAVLYVVKTIERRAEEISREQNEPGLTKRNFHTTLNFAVIQRNVNGDFKVISFAVGDGAIVLCKNDGGHNRLSSPDRGEFASQTAFITINNIIPSETEIGKESSKAFYEKRFKDETITENEMRNGYLALMTDGVSEDMEDWAKFISETKDIMDRQDNQALLELLNSQVERSLDDKTLVLASSNF